MKKKSFQKFVLKQKQEAPNILHILFKIYFPLTMMDLNPKILRQKNNVRLPATSWNQKSAECKIQRFSFKTECYFVQTQSNT